MLQDYSDDYFMKKALEEAKKARDVEQNKRDKN